MMRWLAGAAVESGPAGSMEVVFAPRTSEAVPFALDESGVLLDAATRTGARRCVEGRTVLRFIVVGLGADRPTVPRRSVPPPSVPPPVLLTMAATTGAGATTITAATATPTAPGSAQINISIDARRALRAAAHRDLPPPRFVSVVLAKQ